MPRNREASSVDRESQEKKSYQTPRVYSYGQVREITKALGLSGKNDGGSGKDKSQP
jgi:hypothetical protein